MKALVAVMLFAALSASAAEQEATSSSNDRWGRVRFLLGSWEGTASGDSGQGAVERRYELVLDGQFIEERDARHRGFLSYDKTRKAFMLRRLDEKGIVSLFSLNSEKSMPAYLIFDSVSFENFGNDWKARDSFEVISADEFIETRELAEPGKDFIERGRIHFKRKK